MRPARPGRRPSRCRPGSGRAPSRRRSRRSRRRCRRRGPARPPCAVAAGGAGTPGPEAGGSADRSGRARRRPAAGRPRGSATTYTRRRAPITTPGTEPADQLQRQRPVELAAPDVAEQPARPGDDVEDQVGRGELRVRHAEDGHLDGQQEDRAGDADRRGHHRHQEAGQERDQVSLHLRPRRTSARGGDLRLGPQDAELVALRVGEDHPAGAGAVLPAQVGDDRWRRGPPGSRPPRRGSAERGRRSRCSRFFTDLASGTSMKSSWCPVSGSRIMHSSWPASFGSPSMST